jgi:hypothetical protein
MFWVEISTKFRSAPLRQLCCQVVMCCRPGCVACPEASGCPWSPWPTRAAHFLMSVHLCRYLDDSPYRIGVHLSHRATVGDGLIKKFCCRILNVRFLPFILSSREAHFRTVDPRSRIWWKVNFVGWFRILNRSLVLHHLQCSNPKFINLVFQYRNSSLHMSFPKWKQAILSSCLRGFRDTRIDVFCFTSQWFHMRSCGTTSEADSLDCRCFAFPGLNDCKKVIDNDKKLLTTICWDVEDIISWHQIFPFSSAHFNFETRILLARFEWRTHYWIVL